MDKLKKDMVLYKKIEEIMSDSRADPFLPTHYDIEDLKEDIHVLKEAGRL